MKTIYHIKSLATTIVVTDKRDQQQAQSTIKLTNKIKLDTIGRVNRVHEQMMQTASIERKKAKKTDFFNKHKH
jgi:hypothetical protein